MTNSVVTAALLGILVAQSCCPENVFGADESTWRGNRAAQPSASNGDDLTPPNDIPFYYRAECGSCHVLYPPNLLSDTSGWEEVMDNLHNHFGDNAELDEPVRIEIKRYLVDHAASSGRRFGSRTSPQRLTTTLWFRRTHGEVKRYFEKTRASSPANCVVCHPRAEYWSYVRKEIRMPKLLRR